MPKVKTNSSAKKRFKLTPSGKIKRAQAFKNHILTKKTTKQKLVLRSSKKIYGQHAMRSFASKFPK